MATLLLDNVTKVYRPRGKAPVEAVKRVRLDVKEIHRQAPAELNVAMAFEGYSLYPPLKVKENIGFALLRQRGGDTDIDARVKEVASLLEIGDVLDRYPSVLSAGQQQRTSLARALI